MEVIWGGVDDGEGGVVGWDGMGNWVSSLFAVIDTA